MKEYEREFHDPLCSTTASSGRRQQDIKLQMTGDSMLLLVTMDSITSTFEIFRGNIIEDGGETARGSKETKEPYRISDH